MNSFNKNDALNEDQLKQVSGGSGWGNQVTITDQCFGCGTCVEVCPVKCLSVSSGKAHLVSECVGCGICEDQCPAGAIKVVTW